MARTAAKTKTAATVSETVVEEKAIAPTTILSMWKTSEGARKEADLEMNFQFLQADGEKAMIEARLKVNNAKKAYDNTLYEAAKTPNFAQIAKAKLTLKAAELEFSNAAETYRTIFGTTPSIAK